MNGAPELERIQHLEEVMGTVVTFDLFVPEEVERGAIFPQLSRARASLHHAEAVFSIWKLDSPMSLLRRGEASLGEMPPEVAQVLEHCAAAKRLSRGFFDPWAMPGGVDPTGYVKGWAAQRALDLLRPLPLVGAIVNAAGDIACFGGPEPGQQFRVGIADPSAKGRLTAIARVEHSIATSGTSERGEHLLNPMTGERQAASTSASVTGPDLGMADALATALAVAGPEGLEILAAIPDYEGYLIAEDGQHLSTDGFPFTEVGLPTLRR